MTENGYQLEFFLEQNQRHGKVSLYEWLIGVAKEQGVTGATVFNGSLGFGQHRCIHSAHFFELSDQPMQITMIVTEDESKQLLEYLASEGVDLFYVKIPVIFGRFTKN